MPKTKKKKTIKVHDLKPKKDAKGGSLHLSSSHLGSHQSSNLGSHLSSNLGSHN
jgi:hypothetical protein